MKSRVIGLAAVVILSTAVAAGMSDVRADTEEPPTTATEPPCAVDAPPDSALEGSLTWMSWSPIPEQAEKWIGWFNEQYPDVTIEYEFSLYADYVNALRLAVSGGEAPDLWISQPGAFIHDYAEFAEDLAPWAERQWGSGWKDMFFEGALNETTVDGKVAGLPDNTLAAGYVWYNADIFEELSLEPPTTLDELIALVEPLEASGLVPFAHGAAESWANFDLFMAIANQTAPGELYTAETGETSWTSPGLVEAMDIWQRLFDSGVIQDGALGALQYPDAADLFQQGDAAMIMMGTWYNINMTQQGLDQRAEAYGITDETIFLPFRFPDVDGDGELAPLAVGPGSMYTMSSDSENKEAAWAFMVHMLSVDVLVDEYVSRHMQPALRCIELNSSNVVGAEQQAALEAQSDEIAASTFPREFTIPEVQTALGDALQKVASGQASPEDALAEVEAALDS